MEVIFDTMGKRITKAREEAGLSKSEVARRIGISPASFGMWEADKTKPRNFELQKALAETLGVTVPWLMSGFGEQSAKVVEETSAKIQAERKAKEVYVISGKDKRMLEDIELVIRHLRDLNISSDEKDAVYYTLAEIRNDVERRVILGVRRDA